MSMSMRRPETNPLVSINICALTCACEVACDPSNAEIHASTLAMYPDPLTAGGIAQAEHGCARPHIDGVGAFDDLNAPAPDGFQRFAQLRVRP